MIASKRAGRVAVLAVGALLQMLPACLGVGPASVANGRATYNAVINTTEDQQILSTIVRLRYDETFGLLSVSSVTASLKVGASLGADVGIGPIRGYEGNLVPFHVGATYEENPVISYVPLRGEHFVQRMLSPVSAEQVLLLTRMSTEQTEVLRLLVRRANGIANPLFAKEVGAEEAAAFQRFVELHSRLRDRGKLDVVKSDDGYRWLIHDCAEQDTSEVEELLRTLRLEGRSENGDLIVPLRFFVGARRGGSDLDLETPSALEVLRAAGLGVEVPEVHRAEGVARSAEGRPGFLRIRSSPDRPDDAAVAVRHRGWWFSIDAHDASSKQAFLVVRTLIGLRLDEAASEQGPVLTVPVGG